MRASLLWGVIGGSVLLTQPAPGAPRSGALKALIRPASTLTVRVLDADSGDALPARVYVQRPGVPARSGTVNDDSAGESVLRMAPGRYTVMATRGPEYTIDQRSITLEGGAQTVTLRLRRVVDVGAWVSCDLHLHSSQSFDSRVSPQQRVRSLQAAGVAFAAPTEHNTVGTLPTAKTALLWSPAMEVTPEPAAGHYTVFPYAGETAPATRGVLPASLLAKLRAENPDALIQINHPRLRSTMGLFNMLKIDARRQKHLDLLPTQADTLEVLNGVAMLYKGQTEKVFEEWLQLWESGHRYWATGGSDTHHDHQPPPGYPRTYALPAGLASADGIVKALRQGHAIATTGPFIEISQGTRGPGSALESAQGKATVHLKVQAPPWMDVTSVELWSGARVVWSQALPEHAPRVGPPAEKADDERKEAVRFDADVSITLPAGAHALVAVARGARPLKEAIPGQPGVPLGFTNPMTLLASPPGPLSRPRERGRKRGHGVAGPHPTGPLSRPRERGRQQGERGERRAVFPLEALPSPEAGRGAGGEASERTTP